jgi:hypothetical protein
MVEEKFLNLTKTGETHVSDAKLQVASLCILQYLKETNHLQ